MDKMVVGLDLHFLVDSVDMPVLLVSQKVHLLVSLVQDLVDILALQVHSLDYLGLDLVGTQSCLSYHLLDILAFLDFPLEILGKHQDFLDIGSVGLDSQDSLKQ